MLNYSVTVASINATPGSQVNLTNPTITLIITADKGFTVTAADFTIGDPLPAEFDGFTFVQDGAQVNCVLDVADSFIMPAAPVDLLVDIDGVAQPIVTEYTITGTYDQNTENTDQASLTDQTYSVSGEVGTAVELYNVTFTADADSLFTQAPEVVISASNFLPQNYVVNIVPIYTGQDITGYQIVVRYLISEVNVTGDSFKVNAPAQEQFVKGDDFYYSHRVIVPSLSVEPGGDIIIDNLPKQADVRFFGDEGALITITESINGGTGVVIYQDVPLVQGTNGFSQPFLISIPGNPGENTYEYFLSGDQAVGYTSPDPIVFKNVAATTVTLEVIPIAGYTATIRGTSSVSRAPGVVPSSEQLNTSLNINVEITKDDGGIVKLQRVPTWQDVSNRNPETNGGTFVLFPLEIPVFGDNTEKLTANLSCVVTTFGSLDVDLLFSIASLFVEQPTATDNSANVLRGADVLIDVLFDDTAPSGNELDIASVTQPTHGTAIIENRRIRYTHDGSANVLDSFQYIANDGFLNSNAATVDITVGLLAGQPLTNLSGTDGIYYINFVTGAEGGTFKVHFDSGAAPDRVEILIDDAVVGDSLFVGDDLIAGSERADAIEDVEAVTNLMAFNYVGANGNGFSYGKSAAWDLRTEDNPVSFTEADDIAGSIGVTRTTNPNLGNQVGIQDLTFTSPIDIIGVTGLDSADGNVCVTAIKPLGATSVVVKVTGIPNSNWSIYKTEFS